MHPYYHQELKHIEIVVQHVNQGTETGKIIEVAYDNLRLELGVPGPITQQSFQLLGKSTTDTWIHSWWKFGSRFGIMVNDTGPDLKKARANDVFLREAFAAIPNISADDLYLLNTCRMFLRVVTLSDITNVEGDRIEASILEGTPPLQTWHDYDWPRQQPSLSVTFWNAWKKAIAKVFVNATETTKLTNPLGEWTVDPTENWQWYYSERINRLYRKSEAATWQIFRPRSQRTTRSGNTEYISSEDDPTEDNLPEDCTTDFLCSNKTRLDH